jgi:hypothetical protein
MNDTPEKPVTLGLARSRFLDSLNTSSDDEAIDPEDVAEDLVFQQQELAEKQAQAEADRALGLTEDEREDLFAHFRDRQPLINTCNVVVALIFLFGVRYGLEAINRRLAGPPLPSQIQLFPDPIIWWFFAGFGALIFPWEITLQLWSLLGHQRTVFLYRQWQKRSTFDYKGGQFKNELGLYQWFILLIALPIGVANMLALNMRSMLGPDAIRECGYAFKPCKVLPYADLRAITYIAPNYAVKPPAAAKLVIDFKNGYSWSSSNWGNENKDIDPAIVRFLVSRVPISITGIEALPPAYTPCKMPDPPPIRP